MNFYALSGLLTFLTSFGFGIFSWIKGAKRLNKIWAIFCFCVAAWGFGCFKFSSVMDQAAVFFWLRIGHIGVILMPAFFLHFIFEFLGQKHYKTLFLIYFLGGVFSFINLTDHLGLTALLIAHLRFVFNEFYVDSPPAPLYPLFLSYYFGIITYAHYCAFKSYKRANALKKNQLKYFLFATVVGFAGGATSFFMVFELDIYPTLHITVPLYPVIMTYAIVNYKLMDIEVIVKKTLVFTGLFAMVMAVVAGVSAITQNLISAYFQIPMMISTALSVAIALVFFDPARKWLVYATDKFLFQRKEDIKLILNRLSKEIITILDLNEVGQRILSTLNISFRPEAGVIIVKNEDETTYRILSCFGYKNAGQTFVPEEPFIQFFTHYDRMINLQTDAQNQTPALVREKMQVLQAVIAIPLFIHIDLIGFLFLGKKKSDQDYTKEEVELFPTMAGQISVALSNARLYDKLKKSQIDFAQQAKMAAIGTLSAGISHEIKNPLNHIRVGISMLRMNKKHGVLDRMDRQKFEEEVFQTLEILDENVKRANDVIERLSSFAKKPKELAIGPVDLRKAIDNALSFLDTEFRNYNIELRKELPSDFPLIKADQHTFEDVFLNLLVNARHGIGEKGRITVSAVIADGELDITIRDTGKGIAKGNLDKIFDPFFTTKDVSRNLDEKAIKGSGLGLFIVREFIQRFGGRITVESEVGRGTAFHLIFPEAVWVKTKKVA